MASAISSSVQLLKRERTIEMLLLRLIESRDTTAFSFPLDCDRADRLLADFVGVAIGESENNDSSSDSLISEGGGLLHSSLPLVQTLASSLLEGSVLHLSGLYEPSQN